jgi:hypothetical protein
MCSYCVSQKTNPNNQTPPYFVSTNDMKTHFSQKIKQNVQRTQLDLNVVCLEVLQQFFVHNTKASALSP